MDYHTIDNRATKQYLIDMGFTDYNNLPNWLECCFYQTARNHADPRKLFELCLTSDYLCEGDFEDKMVGKLVCKAAVLVDHYMEFYPIGSNGGHYHEEYRPYPYDPEEYSLDKLF